MKKVTEKERYIMLPEISIRKIGDIYHLYNRETENIFSIDKFGYEIISLCNGRNSVGKNVSTLNNKYKTKKSKLEKDVGNFVKECLSMKILAPVEDYYEDTAILYEIVRGNYTLDLEEIKEVLKSFPKKKLKVLDMGGGSGRLINFFESYSKSIEAWGIEKSLNMIQIGYTKNQIKKGNRLLYGDMSETNILPKKHFDLVVFGYHSFDSISSSNEAKKVLFNLKSILKDKGKIFIHSLSNKHQPQENKWELVTSGHKFGNLFLDIWSFFRNKDKNIHEVYWCWKIKNKRGDSIKTIVSHLERRTISMEYLEKLLKTNGYKIKESKERGKEMYVLASIDASK